MNGCWDWTGVCPHDAETPAAGDTREPQMCTAAELRVTVAIGPGWWPLLCGERWITVS